MSAAPLFLAIDLSAQGIDLALVDSDAKVADLVTRHVQRQDNGAQDPQDWWRAVRTGIKDLLRRGKIRKEDIRSVSVTGDDFGLVCVDREGGTLNPVHLAAQDNLQPYAQALAEQLGARNLANLVGGGTFSGCAASLASWVQDQQPRHWHDCAAIMNPRGFLTFRFTAQNVCDPSSAAAMRLYNPRNHSWSKMVLDRLKIPSSWLPEVQPGLRMGGRVTATAAKETGLSPGTPVAVGANRTACMAVASGHVDAGATILQLGGAGHLSSLLPAWHKPSDESMEIGCHTVANCWALTIRDVGHDRFIQWYNEQLAATDVQQWRRAGRNAMDMIAEIAAEAPPGSDNLHFIGEPRHGGGLVGLSLQHQRSHVLRCLLESVAYRVRSALTSLEKTGVEIPSLTIVGDGAQNHLWCQIISDVCNRETIACERLHSSLVGAGILAATAIGHYKTPAQIAKKTVPPSQTYAPRRSAARTYDEQATKHQHLTDLLPSLFTDIPAEGI